MIELLLLLSASPSGFVIHLQAPEGTFVSFKSLAFTCTLGSFERNDLIPAGVTFGPVTTRLSHGVRQSLPARPSKPWSVTSVWDRLRSAMSGSSQSRQGRIRPPVCDRDPALAAWRVWKCGPFPRLRPGFYPDGGLRDSVTHHRLEPRVVDRRPDEVQRAKRCQMADRFEARDPRVPQVQFLEPREAAAEKSGPRS